MYRTMLDTPLGPMVAMATSKGLCGLEFVLPDRISMLNARLRRWYTRADDVSEDPSPALAATRSWLDRYLAGDFSASRPPLDARGTAFEMAVWSALLEIPAGQTDTYGSVALRLDRPKGARAVGHGVGHNPMSILVPCHRVVGSDGSLTGYGGGLDRKRWLLSHERGF